MCGRKMGGHKLGHELFGGADVWGCGCNNEFYASKQRFFHAVLLGGGAPGPGMQCKGGEGKGHKLGHVMFGREMGGHKLGHEMLG